MEWLLPLQKVTKLNHSQRRVCNLSSPCLITCLHASLTDSSCNLVQFWVQHHDQKTKSNGPCMVTEKSCHMDSRVAVDSSADTSLTNVVLVTAYLRSFKQFVCFLSHLLTVNSDFPAWTWMTLQCATSCRLTLYQCCCSSRLTDHCQILSIQSHYVEKWIQTGRHASSDAPNRQESREAETCFWVDELVYLNSWIFLWVCLPSIIKFWFCNKVTILLLTAIQS